MPPIVELLQTHASDARKFGLLLHRVGYVWPNAVTRNRFLESSRLVILFACGVNVVRLGTKHGYQPIVRCKVTTPLSPLVVVAPISTCNSSIRVQNQVPGSTVTILLNVPFPARADLQTAQIKHSRFPRAWRSQAVI